MKNYAIYDQKKDKNLSHVFNTIKEAEINNLFPGKNYSFSANRFKEIQIEKNGLTYIANLQDSGYISEKILIGYSNERLTQFYNLTK
jgi:hypothetical protein